MPRKKQYDKEEVTQKAMKLFWDQGYKGTTMRDLQEGMGINLFSIYASFENKQGVFLESLNRYMLLNKMVILEPLLSSEGDLADIRRFFYGFVESVKSGRTPNGCLFANTAMEFGQVNEEASEESRFFHQQVSEQLSFFFQFLRKAYLGVLEKAYQRGILREKAHIEKYANYLIGCTEGLAVIAKVLDEKTLEDFIETTLSTLA